jgi:hypothetical protein
MARCVGAITSTLIAFCLQVGTGFKIKGTMDVEGARSMCIQVSKHL